MSDSPGHSNSEQSVSRCEARERSGSICGEPVLVGKVCYDHAKLGPGDQPECPITGEFIEWPPTDCRQWGGQTGHES